MIHLFDYGYRPEETENRTMESDTEKRNGIPARVTAVYKERYQLICSFGEICGKLKTKEYYNGDEEFPTTGDFVMINYVDNGDSQILSTLKRRTFFSRRNPSPGRGEQAVAANFDYVFILQSLNHDLNPRRLERYVTLAWQSGASPIVILSKADLMPDVSEALVKIQNAAAGVPVFPVSSLTGEGLSALSEYLLPGKTIVFLGSSGVGKSSLLNALAGEERMKVNGIREDDSKGRHTTTSRELIMLKSGAMVIDTPGMRELGMWDVTNGLNEAFSDVEQYLGKCRFSDCKHQTEPGCAIKEAIQNGELPEERFESYLKLKTEAHYSDDKVQFMLNRQKFRKENARNQRQWKKLSNGKK